MPVLLLVFAVPLQARGDVDLYRSIAEAVRSGENYYHAAGRLHRERHYPTRPFFVVRTPVLAYTEAALGETGTRMLALAIGLAACGLWTRRLGARRGALASFIVIAVAAPLGSSSFIHIHDYWSGLLLTAALAAQGRTRVWFAAIAATVREITMPFLGLIVLSGPRRPAMIALIAVSAFLAFHALLVEDTGVASPGWHGNPSAMLQNMRTLTPGQLMPDWLFIPLLIAPLAGWYRDKFALAWFAWFFAFDAAFARPDNSYWLLNVLPAWFVGLAMIGQRKAQSQSMP